MHITWFELNSRNFPPPPLLPACALIFTFCNCIDLFNGGFFPTFAEEIFVYCILAGLESKGRNLWWPNLLQPNSSQSLITKLFRKRVHRHVELSVALRKIISCQMIWYNKNIFLFPEKVFFIIKSEWMIHFSPLLIGVFVLVCPLSFYYPIILMTSLAFFPRKYCTLPTTLEIGKIHNWLHIYWKYPAENDGSGISETLHFKNFWGSMPADLPTVGRLRHCDFSSARAYTYKISCYAPEKNLYKVFYTSLPWFVRTVCCRRLPSQQSLWPAVTLINLAWWSARPAHVTRSVKSSSAACGIGDDTL